ncbi:MAG: hypothetical protein CMO01_17050 [Thalassobius sp.]|nr:hypothetical protein [Thalassovita sp.]
MINKPLLFNLLIVGLTLGTTWAIRGKFGHEQGAAWAGAVAAVAILLISKREDWYNKLFKATLAAAIGWGVGGIMSYGVLVGYGKGTDFINVYYGLLMLFIVGGLYGFLGGGLFGLTLTETDKTRVNWGFLFIGLVAGGIVTYFFLIYEWEWFMTPPRSELWAVCLGMAFFLIWFMVENKYKAAFRVAVFSGLGGGFGFAFGNFLQVLGAVSGIAFNFWNVMEYSLGFFGGIGMAYGTFTSNWETTSVIQKKSSNLIPILLVVFFIPFVVWDQSFTSSKLTKSYAEAFTRDSSTIAFYIQVVSLLALLIFTAFVIVRYYYEKKGNLINYSRQDVAIFFLSLFGLYLFYDFLISAAFVQYDRLEHYLYIVNFIVIALSFSQLRPLFYSRNTNIGKWAMSLAFTVMVLAILAIFLISSHTEMPHAKVRFE